jgi:hypothetical protein
MQLHASSMGASLVLSWGFCVLADETPGRKKYLGERKK